MSVYEAIVIFIAAASLMFQVYKYMKDRKKQPSVTTNRDGCFF